MCRSYSDLNFGVTFLEHSVYVEIGLIIDRPIGPPLLFFWIRHWLAVESLITVRRDKFTVRRIIIQTREPTAPLASRVGCCARPLNVSCPPLCKMHKLAGSHYEPEEKRQMNEKQEGAGKEERAG